MNSLPILLTQYVVKKLLEMGERMMFRYFKYKLNDKVQFQENDGHIYRIIGYRLEKGFDPEREWTHIVYELLREFDGYMLDAIEDEIVRVIQVEEEYYKMSDVFGYQYPAKVKQANRPPLVEVEHQVNDLLDRYNDYKCLSALFQDASYEEKANVCIEQMKKLRNK